MVHQPRVGRKRKSVTIDLQFKGERKTKSGGPLLALLATALQIVLSENASFNSMFTDESKKT